MPQLSARSPRAFLIPIVFVAGLCSIVYELLISTTSSYFLGDSVTQFSLTIGVYLASMGVGSWLSKFIGERLTVSFVIIELLLGLVGGAAVPLLYYAYTVFSPGGYQAFMLGLTAVVGLLTGFEIPLLARALTHHYPLRENLANVLSLDYIGALAATLLFPFLLLPAFGLFRTSAAVGMVNILLGIGVLLFLPAASGAAGPGRRTVKKLLVAALLSLVGFAALLVASRTLLDRWEAATYPHDLVYGEQTPYQALALTRNGEEVRLYINHVIQFSSTDEYRYHESLALIPAGAVADPGPRSVLVLGGGEGLLARELLRLPAVTAITIVDLDPAVFALARSHAALREINEEALADPRVTTIGTDAAQFLRTDTAHYDLVIADLPDPGNEAVARLYSTQFFGLARARLLPGGVFATQGTSPFHTQNAYWCIYETLRAAGFAYVYPYHTNVPSFGEWGFFLALDRPVDPRSYRPTGREQYLDSGLLPELFYFARDLRHPGELGINTLDRPRLLDYYLDDWRRWQRSLQTVEPGA
ncbi:MAG: polyamine aminopropyltransferase, partial [Saprospiraceae bacterium]